MRTHTYFLLLLFFASAQGFVPYGVTTKTIISPPLKGTISNEEEEPTNDSLKRRRDFIQYPIQLALLTQIASSLPANAAPGEKIKPPLTPEEAEVKFREGYKTINYLLDNYDEVCDGGGDNVRRYLGTVVGIPPSALVGLGKTMNALSSRADDFIEFTELSEEIIKCIDQASGSAYMSIFVNTSTSYTPPKKYFDDAKIEVKRCKKAMEELAAMVDIKL
jgi:hypothetical protein